MSEPVAPPPDKRSATTFRLQRRSARRPRRLFAGRSLYSRLLASALAVLATGCVVPDPPSAAPPASGSPEFSRATPDPLHRQGPFVRNLVQAKADIQNLMVPGNAAELLIDGPQTHAAMLQAIAAARDHIHLESYILEPRADLTSLLLAKRAEGVQVKVLYDSIGSLGTPSDYFKDLSDAGIATCEFNPASLLRAGRGEQLNNRDHRKLLVVDGKVAFTGGINISRVYATSSFARRKKEEKAARKNGWRDTDIRVAGPVVADFQRLFLNAWDRQKCPPISGENAFPNLDRQGDQAMRVVAADPQIGRSELYVALQLAIAGARQRIWLTYGYFVPDDGMLEALIKAAQHGVDVRLILPGFSDFWAPFHAGRARYGELLTAGARIFERRDALLHAKTAVIDSVWSNVGSTNLDWRSFVSNYEADVIVFDSRFAQQMERLFDIDQAASHEVSLQEWEQRGALTRAKEWVARWWERWL